MTIEGDHLVDDIPAVNASQSWDPASSLVDDLGYSQAGTAGALHNLSLLHDCKLGSLIQVVACGWIRNSARRSAQDLFANREGHLADRPELKIRKQSMKAPGRLVEIHVVTELGKPRHSHTWLRGVDFSRPHVDDDRFVEGCDS